MVADAERYLSEGKSVMFLTTCSYMLQNLVKELRDTGTPFHNPYRRRNGAWNPLQKRRGQTSTADRVAAFLQMEQRGAWSAEEVNHWTGLLKIKGALKGRGREGIKVLTDAAGPDSESHVDWDALYAVLTEEAIEAGLTGDLDWLDAQMTAAKRSSAKFPLAIARNRGAASLTRTPLACVGTVHSVKGAESDVVYVFPDLSRAGMREWTGSPAQQATVYRLFYVAMTRARETLVLCAPSEEYAVDLDG